jgi:hypothetical protein
MGSRVPMGGYNFAPLRRWAVTLYIELFFSELDPGSFLLDDNSEVDVVSFFDCRYSFLTTRAINSPGRVNMEVLGSGRRQVEDCEYPQATCII